MGKDPRGEGQGSDQTQTPAPWSWSAAAALAAIVGLGLMIDSLQRSSATYDEVTYLEVAAKWWRTGDQSGIAWMGSPALFWKLQQVPVLWALDHSGHRDWVDDPIRNQAEVLPLVRLASLWIWLIALGLVALWSRLLYGRRAMALAAWLFTLSPNLLGHATLVTMELPLIACTTGMFLLFWRFLQTGDRRLFRATAALGGIAWSCKYTAVVIPPILATVWWVDRWRTGEKSPLKLTLDVSRKMLGFMVVLAAANVVVTGFALLPLSQTHGAHPGIDARAPAALRPLIVGLVELPLPQDLVGFIHQVLQQRGGGPSYLWGERRMTGWWSYYFIALAVKVPLTFWLLFAGRAWLGRGLVSSGRSAVLPAVMAMFLAIAAAGSSRNFGIRYLLPLAPLAIVWVSGLAEARGRTPAAARRWATALAGIGVAGQAVAVAAVHPYELTYFHRLAGGPTGGRRILADSNLDWGQGLKSLARLQREDPRFRDLTLYYFGNTEPRYYGVQGTTHLLTAVSTPPDLPAALSSKTKYVAVSVSLQWGPWGPEGYFRALDAEGPICMTSDHTIAIYDAARLPRGMTLRAN